MRTIQLGTITFTNKQDYINAVLNTAPAQLDTIKIIVGACNYITWYWNGPVAENRTLPIKGIHIFEANPKTMKLTEAWFEFDSLAAAIDEGLSVLTPDGEELVLTVAE